MDVKAGPSPPQGKRKVQKLERAGYLIAFGDRVLVVENRDGSRRRYLFLALLGDFAFAPVAAGFPPTRNR